MAEEKQDTTASEQEEGTQETPQSASEVRTAKNTVAVEEIGP